MEIITFAQAKELGERFYFTGNPCVRGHISHRYVNGRRCAKCSVEDTKKAKQQNPEIDKKFYSIHKNRILEKKKKYKAYWYQKNKEKLKLKLNDYSKAWKIANPDKHSATQARRRSKKLQATPAWLNDCQIKSILLEYELAKWCSKVMGEKYHVDHIIPLKGDTVCGLHVPWNLQVITAKTNLTKGNKIVF